MDAETKVILEQLRKDVHDIKLAMVGEGDKPGLILDVDRLKRSRASIIAVLWALFTGFIGAMAAVAATRMQ